ncbi:MAG: hypothetical protein D6757_08135 [Alphaproteobacteria bacterium]|nr:MAG: hypothetical protein D6757_08135 [Alphaproteobacteria bacterium]
MPHERGRDPLNRARRAVRAAAHSPSAEVPARDPRVREALRYPYPHPPHDYLYWRGRHFPLPAALPGAPLDHRLRAFAIGEDLPAGLRERLLEDATDGIAGLARRHAVLACGSNQSPERLARKFRDCRDALVPVTRITIHEHAVFHAAVLTRYGAVAATIASCPGAAADIAITWLTDEQLAVMNATEDIGDIYELSRLAADHLSHHDHPLPYYRAIRGLFAPDGVAVALAGIAQILPAHVPVAGQGEMLLAAHRLVGARHVPDFENFVIRLIEDAPFRRACEEELGERFAVIPAG